MGATRSCTLPCCLPEGLFMEEGTCRKERGEPGDNSGLLEAEPAVSLILTKESKAQSWAVR